MRWLNGMIYSTDMNLSKLWEIVKDREAWRTAVHGVAKSRTWLSDWTTKATIPFGSSWHASAGNTHLCPCFFCADGCSSRFTLYTSPYWMVIQLCPQCSLQNKVSLFATCIGWEFSKSSVLAAFGLTIPSSIHLPPFTFDYKPLGGTRLLLQPLA